MYIPVKYPIETEVQMKFWSSRHVNNVLKAMIAFTDSEDEFKNLARRRGYKYAWREKAWKNFNQFSGQVDMLGIPYSDSDQDWWDENPA
ncbi:hypothetical protein CGI18_07245 [Vibrio parahaemolyticus]|nr:hypothetical protein CGI18_07245 [Vibrio parahaemolyticus]